MGCISAVLTLACSLRIVAPRACSCLLSGLVVHVAARARTHVRAPTRSRAHASFRSRGFL